MANESLATYQQRIGYTVNAIAEEVQRIVSTVVQNPLVTFRVKDSETLRKKMRLKHTQSVFSIDDVYGIRIIVESVDETYRVLEKVEQTFPGYLDHDYIQEPKRSSRPNPPGKMLRLLQFIAHRNGVSFEIQITTSVFHAMNEPLHEEYHRRKYRSSNL